MSFCLGPGNKTRIPIPAGTARLQWCVNWPGLLTTDMADEVRDHRVPYARLPAESRGWKAAGAGCSPDIAEVRRVRPTMLIGTSSSPGSVYRSYRSRHGCAHRRPIIFPLSSPASRAEANPADLISWTDGRALVAPEGRAHR